MRSFQFHGSRIIKTGLAIFLTAVICEWFNWPPVFAVITAIVTIEPTVSDSIKKGIVRFPASAIGSAFAVFFIALFGNSPITYTLAAVCTILVCYRLKLHAGLLVATLTAVAMVEVIHSNYLIAFFIRLGTTTTGLLVSTAVNMLVFPPNYSKAIAENIQRIGERAGGMLEQTFRTILYDSNANHGTEQAILDQLTNEIRKTETLIYFQRDESKLHLLAGGNKEALHMAEKQLVFLHKLEYHVGTLLQMPLSTISWTTAERDLIMQAVTELADDLKSSRDYDSVKHQQQLKNITDLFWEDNEELTKNNEIHPTQFPPELIILYELVAIYNLVDQFYHVE
ncbi:aromatic acid exporter family protein [Sporosarcina sp.]|uniref:aromatic acid exporter family protein n=1 Tax=Sporosarcina sp. TaxID=49982 RepID=UPI00261F9B58|nr:aromatic acid exporter family protein [Sporosarcina sp.]